MKPLFLLLSIASILSLSSIPSQALTYVLQKGDGYHIGTGTSQRVGFYGAAPVVQASGTAELALSDSTGGILPASVIITGSVAPPIATGTVTVSGSGAALTLFGVIPGDVLLSAVISGTTTSVASDFQATITGSNQLLQTGTASLVSGSTQVVVSVGRYPVQTFVPLVSATSTAATNADLAVMARTINELRWDLVNLGIIKGGP